MAISPFKMNGFSGFGNSPVKQKIDLVGRTSDVIHKAEKGIGAVKESIKNSLKKIKSNIVIFKNSEIIKQLKNAGSKVKLKDMQKALTKNILPKVAKFVPVINLVTNLMSTSATATQPGTGKHGGKKRTTYNPKTEKYE